jgi:membrane protease subunit (stomatin/prohibitin family)
MDGYLEFSNNYHDLSTDTGFQFEFTCNRCSSGFRSPFKGYAAGTASSILNTAGSLFGGLLSSAATVGEQVRSAKWQQAHDVALKQASQEVKGNFIQCPRCSKWVCRKSCWNDKKGLCKECAPDLGVEMAAAQASKSVEEVWANAAMAEEDKHLTTEDWREGIRATCPACGIPLPRNVKFCPECGANIKARDKCANCGAKLEPNAKFCAECGTKTN